MLLKRKSHFLIAMLLTMLAALLWAGTIHAPEEPVEEPSPKKHTENSTVVFSCEAGYYPDGLILSLSCEDGLEICYTTDGSVPNEDSPRYRGPLSLIGSGNGWLNEETADLITVDGVFKLFPTEDIPDAWVIRAAVVSPDGTMGPVTTKTYFAFEDPSFLSSDIMIVSVITDSDNLLDYDTGIMAAGRIFDEWYVLEESRKILADKPLWYLIKANFTQKGDDWERPASVELFDLSKDLYVQQDAGLRMHGKCSLQFTHKSYRIYFRKQYGKKGLGFDLFEDGYCSHKSLVLKNGGNAEDQIPYKDALQQHLLSGRSFLTQKTRPAVLYINGEYWGAYTVTERYTDSLLMDRFALKDVVMIKEQAYDDGDDNLMYLYNDLVSFLNKDMRDPAVWAEFCDIVDVEEFAEFCAARVYMADYDFSFWSNNGMFCSTDTSGTTPYADGKWHFMMYDTEYSSGLYDDGTTSYDFDSISHLISNHALFASAIASEEFRALFLKCLKEIGSQDLSYKRVCSAIDKWDTVWAPLLEDQYRRFGDNSEMYRIHITQMKEFYKQRYSFIIPLAEELLAVD